jgi:CO/xanthine dehydrogenase Mo-binding subunit
MADYEALKASVAKNGEVKIRLDTGEKIELHIHNTKFNDATKEVIVDAASETYFIGVDRVSYYWIHKESMVKE